MKTDFQKTINLLLALSYGLALYSSAEDTRDTLVWILTALQVRAIPGDRHAFLRTAKRFVDSAAWSMIYNRIQVEHNPNMNMGPEQIVALDSALKNHFEDFVNKQGPFLLENVP